MSTWTCNIIIKSSIVYVWVRTNSNKSHMSDAELYTAKEKKIRGQIN